MLIDIIACGLLGFVVGCFITYGSMAATMESHRSYKDHAFKEADKYRDQAEEAKSALQDAARKLMDKSYEIGEPPF